MLFGGEVLGQFRLTSDAKTGQNVHLFSYALPILYFHNLKIRKWINEVELMGNYTTLLILKQTSCNPKSTLNENRLHQIL